MNNNRDGILNIVHKTRRNKRQIMITSQLPQMVMKNLLSAKSFNSIKSTTSIGTAIGSPQWLFTSTGTNYWNIAQILASSTVFVDSLAKYTLFRITGVKVEIQRTLPEAGTAISGIFASATVPPIFALFSPTYTTTGSLPPLPQCSTSIQYDPFVMDRQRGSFNFPPIFAYNNNSTSAGSQHMYGQWNTLGALYTNMPGSVQISPPVGGSNALTATIYWTCTVTVDCEFACDYA